MFSTLGEELKTFCFTIDLDRDVNVEVPNELAAGSLSRGGNSLPRFESTFMGLSLLSDLLDDIGIKATYFAEGRTLEKMSDVSGLSGHEVGVHGYDHENLTNLSEDEIYSIVSKTAGIVFDKVGYHPKCFRAPYMNSSDSVLKAISRAGFSVDSSEYSELSDNVQPYEIYPGIIEVPVTEGKDINGKKIAAYLWPMHENKRIPEDYVNMANEIKSGVFVLATHTWHITESRSSGYFNKENLSRNLDAVSEVLSGILDAGFVPMTLSELTSK